MTESSEWIQEQSVRCLKQHTSVLLMSFEERPLSAVWVLHLASLAGASMSPSAYHYAAEFCCVGWTMLGLAMVAPVRLKASHKEIQISDFIVSAQYGWTDKTSIINPYNKTIIVYCLGYQLRRDLRSVRLWMPASVVIGTLGTSLFMVTEVALLHL